MFQEADESLAGREGVLGVLVHELFSLRSTYLPEVYLRLGGGEAGWFQKSSLPASGRWRGQTVPEVYLHLGGGEAGRFRGGTGLVRQGIPPRSQAGDHSAA